MYSDSAVFNANNTVMEKYLYNKCWLKEQRMLRSLLVIFQPDSHLSSYTVQSLICSVYFHAFLLVPSTCCKFQSVRWFVSVIKLPQILDCRKLSVAANTQNFDPDLSDTCISVKVLCITLSHGSMVTTWWSRNSWYGPHWNFCLYKVFYTNYN